MGRPSDYTPETADLICARLVGGESLLAICRDDAMPDPATVYRWLNAHPEFCENYTRARDIHAELKFDEIQEIADDGKRDYVLTGSGPLVDHDHIARSRLRVDTLKWRLARMAPKKYGDKLETTHRGDAAAPIVISSTDGKL